MKQGSDPHKQVLARLHCFSRVAGWSKTKDKGWFIGSRFFTRLRSGERGQSLVELAFALPMLLIVVMGVFSIGMGMIVYEQLGEAAFAGDQAMAANQGVFNPGTSTPTDLCAKAYTAVTTVLGNWSTTNLGKITYSATLANTVGTTTTTTTIPASTGSFSCSAQSIAGDLGPESQVTLTLQYPYTWLPIINPVTQHLISLGTFTLTAQQSVLAF